MSKYKDAIPYPKIQSEGYEKEFKSNYEGILQQMMKTLTKQILELKNNK